MRESFARAVAATTDLTLAGTADDLPQGLQLFDNLHPDVLLVDIGLPSGSGLQLIRHASQQRPACNIMVVTVFAEGQLVLNCIEAGATGYLLKGSGDADVVAQIRTLINGGSPISPLIARRLLSRFTESTTQTPAEASTPTEITEGSPLSAQELSVLQMAAKGYTYEECARLLGLSHHTVETYVKRIYRKLQVHSKTAALFEARKMGIMDE